MLAGQYMIALNMFNQAPLLPRIIRQILILLTKLPYEAAFVSIYESNSLDTTGNPMTLPLASDLCEAQLLRHCRGGCRILCTASEHDGLRRRLAQGLSAALAALCLSPQG